MFDSLLVGGLVGFEAEHPEAAAWFRNGGHHQSLSSGRILRSAAAGDLFAGGTVRNFQALSALGKAPQHLWMGPWAHTVFDQYFAELNLGPQASAASCGIIAAFNRFIDIHLK